MLIYFRNKKEFYAKSKVQKKQTIYYDALDADPSIQNV